MSVITTQFLLRKFQNYYC